MHWAVSLSIHLSVHLSVRPSVRPSVRLSIKRIDDALNQGPFGCNNGHLAANLINFVLARYVLQLPPLPSLLSPSLLPLPPSLLAPADHNRVQQQVLARLDSTRLTFRHLCSSLWRTLQFKGIRVENMQEKN